MPMKDAISNMRQYRSFLRLAFIAACLLSARQFSAFGYDAEPVLGENTADFSLYVIDAPVSVASGQSFSIRFRVPVSPKYKLQLRGEYGGTEFFAETLEGQPHPHITVLRVDELSDSGTIEDYGVLYFKGAVEYTVVLHVADSVPDGEPLAFRLAPQIDLCEKTGGLCLRISTPNRVGNSLFVPPVYAFNIKIDVSAATAAPVKPVPPTVAAASGAPVVSKTPPVATPRRGLWRAVGGFFLLGLLATLMPCTYPMIPLVVSRLAGGSPTGGLGASAGAPIERPKTITLVLTWLAFLAGMSLVTIALGAIAGGALRLMGSVVVSVWFNALTEIGRAHV